MESDRDLVATSGWFDPEYYLRTYPDVARLNMDPLDHFLWIGYRLLRNPSEKFNTRKYIEFSGDVEGNPLIHFLRSGANRKFLSSSISSGAAPKSHRPPHGQRTIIFISGEALDRPGFLYRIDRWKNAFQTLDLRAVVFIHSDYPSHLEEIAAAEAIFIWRARYNDVAEVYRIAKNNNVPIIYDLDDLMCRPELATAKYIDAIRFDKRDPQGVKDHYLRIRRAMEEADFSTASTNELAWHMRLTPNRNPTFVLPNGFAKDTYLKSRVEARRKRLSESELIRIGYASGSRTHQADFRLCSRAVADILRENDNCCLVLFRRNTLVTLDLNEYPEFSGLTHKIEWREFVKLEDLPKEIARFDINLAPLEVGNPFCEAKSELKFFEAAICDVPTVASPTGPFARAIQHGESGLLATTREEWYSSIQQLIDNPNERHRIGREAHRRALWQFGPLRRVEIAASLLEQLRPGRAASRAAYFGQQLGAHTTPVPLVDRRIVKEIDNGRPSPVTVIVPLYNYEKYIEETLNSVAAQTMSDIDLVIVDDCSTDHSGRIAEEWMSRYASRFNRAVLVRHLQNSGLGNARNTAFDISDSLYIMCLDADNRLLPTCCSRLHEIIEQSGAAFVYPTIRKFGDATGVMGNADFMPASLIPGNYIDAMAMVSKEAWAFVGGYPAHRMGWQDFHFWCRMVDRGLHGVHASEILAEYRVHNDSMLSSTNRKNNKKALCEVLEKEFSWLSLLDERSSYRVPKEEE